MQLSSHRDSRNGTPNTVSSANFNTWTTDLKIERLLAITVMLLNRRRITARELAERFEVSVRTIYRDVETLNGAGIPVVSSQGHEGGLTMPDNYKLSRQLLTFADMLSLLTALKGVNKTLQDGDIERLIDKVTALIPEEKEPLYRSHADSFVIDISPWGPAGNHRQTVQTVHEAVNSSLLLDFAYTGTDGRPSQRRVEPHTLVYKSFTWYLLAYCRTRLDFRIFRLSRMRSLQKAEEHFVRRPVAPLDRFFEGDSRPPVELTLKFAPSVRIKVEEHFAPPRLRYEADGSLIANLTMPEDDWIMSFLLGFGSDVEVLAPPRWREAIEKKCTAMRNIYTNLT
jgi:predicted DNA-binding transcriptional regulator YafY